MVLQMASETPHLTSMRVQIWPVSQGRVNLGCKESKMNEEDLVLISKSLISLKVSLTITFG